MYQGQLLGNSLVQAVDGTGVFSRVYRSADPNPSRKGKRKERKGKGKGKGKGRRQKGKGKGKGKGNRYGRAIDDDEEFVVIPDVGPEYGNVDFSKGFY